MPRSNQIYTDLDRLPGAPVSVPALLMFRRGIAHPVAVYYPSESQVYDVDSLLDPWLPKPEERDFAAYDFSYLHDLQNSKPGLFNGSTFTLKQIRQNPLQLRGQIGSYYDMLATCAAFERELWDAVEAGLLRAPNRSIYHRYVAPAESLIRGEKRSAAIGIGTLIVFNDGETYRAILAKRSRATAFDSDMYHVLPAMMFGPTTANFADPREWSVTAPDSARAAGRALWLAGSDRHADAGIISTGIPHCAIC